MKISIITATHNCAPVVRDCLASIAGQSYRDVEHIVIDGESTDGTLEILQAHRSKISVLVSEPDHGIYDALNKGIALATGDVVGFLHSDDTFAHSEVLARVAAVFEDPAVSAVYGDLQYVRQEDAARMVRHWVSGPFSMRRLAWGWMPPHPTLYVRRKYYDRIGGFDKRYQIAADYYSILQMFTQADFKAEYLPEVMVRMRLGGLSNRSLNTIVRKSREDWDAMRTSGYTRSQACYALIYKNLSKVKQFL
jgi:glycosyltransferase